MSKISILNMRPSPLVVPSVVEWKTMNVRGVETKVKGKTLHKTVILKPGPNRDVMSKEHWDLVEGRCKSWIEGSIITVIDSEEQVPEKFDPDAQIKYQTVKQAKAVISEETDLSKLQAWHENDARVAVRKAIEARLTEMPQN